MNNFIENCQLCKKNNNIEDKRRIKKILIKIPSFGTLVTSFTSLQKKEGGLKGFLSDLCC